MSYYASSIIIPLEAAKLRPVKFGGLEKIFCPAEEIEPLFTKLTGVTYGNLFRPPTLTGHSFVNSHAIMMHNATFKSHKPYQLTLNLKNTIAVSSYVLASRFHCTPLNVLVWNVNENVSYIWKIKIIDMMFLIDSLKKNLFRLKEPIIGELL